MATGFSGGGWPWIVDEGNFQEEFSKHDGPCRYSLAINGVIAWIESMQGGLANAVWMAEGEKHFDENEVTETKNTLWKASGAFLEEVTNRKGESKKKKEFEDIGNALLKLKEDDKLPLIVATSRMVRRAPTFGGITGTLIVTSTETLNM